MPEESENPLIKDIVKPLEVKSVDGEITLKQFTPQDAKEIFELIDASREHLSQFGDDTARKYPTYESVLESINKPTNTKRLRFGIRNKEGQLVGSINLTPVNDKPEIAEIGYYLGVSSTGRGYASKAVETLTDYGFNKLGMRSIFGKVIEANISSAKVLIRAGYMESEKKDGEIIYTKIKE